VEQGRRDLGTQAAGETKAKECREMRGGKAAARTAHAGRPATQDGSTHQPSHSPALVPPQLGMQRLVEQGRRDPRTKAAGEAKAKKRREMPADEVAACTPARAHANGHARARARAHGRDAAPAPARTPTYAHTHTHTHTHTRESECMGSQPIQHGQRSKPYQQRSTPTCIVAEPSIPVADPLHSC
jgi:hypothetical protein